MPRRFLLAVLLFSLAVTAVRAVEPVDSARNIEIRDGLPHSRTVFEKTKKGHVAFLGGSITEMDGYRSMVCENLKQRFPSTEFTFTAAGMASTCSTSGAFRLERDVLSKGPVDLFFVEFAVNDDQDAHHAIPQAVRGMEGIVRHLWAHNPDADIVITYFVNEDLMRKYREGGYALDKAADSILAHRKVAEYYGIPEIDLAREVTRRIDDKLLTWKEFGGVHPAPLGNRICADMIETLFDAARGTPDNPKPVVVRERIMPEPLDRFSYTRGRLTAPDAAKPVAREEGQGEWTLGVPDWKSIPGGFRQTFADLPVLASTVPGAEFALDFEGTAIGAFVLAGPDAGIANVRIDDGEWKKVVLFHEFSGSLHYPRTVMFADELREGKHRLILQIDGQKPEKSTGHAVRILHFAEN